MSVVLFTPERAYGASLRHWGRHDAKRLALAVAWGRYGDDDACAELATALAWHAERAGFKGISCRAVAASMIQDELDLLDAKHDAVLQRMIVAAEAKFSGNRRDAYGAANAAADIARAEVAPPSLIGTAFRIARWRASRRA